MSAPVQLPLIRIPSKSTEDVDLASAVSHLITNSYGQEPKQFSEQLGVLTHARQDAVRGAGSDATGRDLLYKWFHMLEMLELRFPDLRAPFAWKDAFTQKAITQHSLAYEKASVIFSIASVLSSIGARTHRVSSSNVATVSASGGAKTTPASPASAPGSESAAAASGTKLAYTSLRQAAGMLTYINDNFLHAPSTDMSKDVVRWLIQMQLAQATEVFWEKTLDEKKGGNLVARIASQIAVMNTSLAEESKEWVSRAVFERSWSLLVQTKAKYFASVAQYYRALIDEAATSHGSCLVRLTLAETLGKEAQKLSMTFAPASTASSSSSSATGTLSADAASSLRILVETHLAIVSARKGQAVRDNDLIYHDILPTESTLPAIEPLAVAQPISIQDIYASPEVQKLTGATATGTPASDLFSALIPLGVHEAASMYSEEKAQLVRDESERVEMANIQLDTALDSMSLPKALKKFKPNGVDDLLDPGSEAVGWAEEEIQGGGSRGQDGLGTGSDAIDEGLRKVNATRERARQDLDEASRLLDEEAAQCERLRVRYGERWSQSPSGLEAKGLRSDLKSNKAALVQASDNDVAIERLWRQSQPLIRILLGGREALETALAEALSGASAGQSNANQLVDLLQEDDGGTAKDQETVQRDVTEIESRLSGLQRAKKERNDALSEVRSKIQSDDISHLLILNRRASAEAQTQLFKQELEKFRPLTQKIAKTVTDQERALSEISQAWKQLNEAPSGRTRAQEWERKNASRERLMADLRRAKDDNAQVRAGLAKGLTFYTQLQDLASNLRRSARSFVEERGIERERLIREMDMQSPTFATGGSGHMGGARSPVQPSRYDGNSLESAFGRMGVNDRANQAGQSIPGQSPVHLQQHSVYEDRSAPQSYRQNIPASSPYDALDKAFVQSSAPAPIQRTQPTHNLHPNGDHRQPSSPGVYGSGYDAGQSAYSDVRQNSYGGGASYQSPPPPHQQLYQQSTQRQPSLPPPPPQWQPSYGGTSNVRQQSGPPPAPLPGQQSYGGSAQPLGYGAPTQSYYSSFPSPPSLRATGGPPPPPLPPGSQRNDGYSSYGQYGQGPPPPPPPPPQHQQQRWQQPPY